MKITNNSANEQPIDLVYTGWKWFHHDQHNIMKNLVMPINDINDELDSSGSFIVQSPDSHLLFSTPITDTLNTTYSPSKETLILFKLFSDMNSAPESYVDFANKYGTLKHAEILFLDDRKDNYVFGESILFWYRQQWMLKYAGLLWEWIKNNDKEKLSLVIKWKDERNIDFQLGSQQTMENFISNKFSWTGYAYVFHFGKLECCINNNYRLSGKISNVYAIRQQTQVGDILLPAINLLQSIINYYLYTYPTKLTLFYNVKKRHYQQHLTPTNLLGAMWYQFQQVITGERKIKQCPICRQWSDVTTIKGSWEKHRDCANWDRVTKGRKIKKILALKEQGLFNQDIANDVNVDIYDVERWLGEEYQKQKEGVSNAK